MPEAPCGKHWPLGGDYYLAEYAPSLIRHLVGWFKQKPGPRTLREVGHYMLAWNVHHNLKQYHFQYAAFVADIADWFPHLVHRDTMFYYGSNAEQCISYLAKKPRGNKIEFLDAVMLRAMRDTGGLPYNLEDVCCDFIRWVENYVKPGHDYDHLDRDNLWSSSPIKDHPFGRQKAMLDLGLITSFNNLDSHPTGDWVIKQHEWTPDFYRKKVKEAMYTSS